MAGGRFPFFRRPRRTRPPVGTGLRLFLHGRGTFGFDLIGLTPFMGELRDIADAGIWMGERQDCLAVLVCHDGTPLERNTVAVEIAGRMVGYCPSYLSTRYREWLDKWRFAGASICCNAIIVGRRGQAGSRLLAQGVKLDIELPFKTTTML